MVATVSLGLLGRAPHVSPPSSICVWRGLWPYTIEVSRVLYAGQMWTRCEAFGYQPYFFNGEVDIYRAANEFVKCYLKNST